MARCPQICVGMWDGWPVDLYTQYDLVKHHLAQPHEHMPTIKPPWFPPIYAPNLMGSPKKLWLVSFHNPYSTFHPYPCSEMNILINRVQFTYLWTMVHIHIPFSSYHSGLATTLRFCATSKLKNCALTLGALWNVPFFYCVPLSVDLGVHSGVPPLYRNPR